MSVNQKGTGLPEGRLAPKSEGYYRCFIKAASETDKVFHLTAGGVCFSKKTERVSGSMHDTVREPVRGTVQYLTKEQLDAVDRALRTKVIRGAGPSARVFSTKHKRYKFSPQDVAFAHILAMEPVDESIARNNIPEPPSLAELAARSNKSGNKVKGK